MPQKDLDLISRLIQADQPTPEEIRECLTWLYGNPVSRIYRFVRLRYISYSMLLDLVAKYNGIQGKYDEIESLENQIVKTRYSDNFSLIMNQLSNEEREELFSLIQNDARRYGIWSPRLLIFSCNSTVSFLLLDLNLLFWSREEGEDVALAEHGIFGQMNSFISTPDPIYMRVLNKFWEIRHHNKEILTRFVALFSILRQ